MKDATQFHIRPARPEEAGLFYTPHPEEDKRLGTVGHVRMDFGRSGNEFWHTWWPRGPEELNSPAFKAELQEVVDTLRESVLKNRFAMERFCYEHAALSFPIALSVANQLNVDPTPFFVVICMAASASFSTPIGYQTNLIVQGVGGYKFMDFVKIGLPLNVISFLISIFVIPLIWEF